MSEYQCRFCNSAFSRERTLSAHLCERKRRWMDKDEHSSRMAFIVWCDFMKYVSPNAKKARVFEDFIKSKDYIGFSKFGNYLIELRPYESDKFIQWLFRMSVRLSDWTKPGTYQLYVQEAAKKETAERALERTILTIREWGETSGEDWQDFFKKIAPATAMNMVVLGRISPWIIYSVDAAQQLLDRMEPGQIETVTKHVDTKWWKEQIKNHQSEASWINSTMTQALS